MIVMMFGGNGGFMNNTERLMRLSQALGFEALDIVEVFELGHIKMGEEEVEKLLLGQNASPFEYETLEAFLNGLIVFNRGESPLKPGQTERKPMMVEDPRSINNVMLKKLKIAFSLSSEDMLDLFKVVEISISKDKLSSLFRKEGHKSYKYCRDVYVVGFLKALGQRSMM